MPPRMMIQQSLSAIWEHIVRSGEVRNQFVGANGRRIESGIRVANDCPEHYAVDLDSNREMGADVLERVLDGSRFVLQLNQYRALKPKTGILGLGRQPDCPAGVGECFFACQDPTNPLSLLRRNSHLQIRLQNYQWAAFHNAFPVDRNGHFLWVPFNTFGAIAAIPHSVQALTLPLLQDFLTLALSSSGLMTFFNSMHAGASVNHIHYHSVYRAARMPIEEASTVARDGHLFLDGYPASGLAYPATAPAEHIWRDAAKLQEAGVPINVLHCGERTCLFARNIDQEVVEEFPGGILAGMELSGKAITTEESFYQQADWAMMQTALRKSTLRDEQVLTLLKP